MEFGVRVETLDGKCIVRFFDMKDFDWMKQDTDRAVAAGCMDLLYLGELDHVENSYLGLRREYHIGR